MKICKSFVRTKKSERNDNRKSKRISAKSSILWNVNGQR